MPQDALDVALKIALSIPLEDIRAYQKVAKAYFSLLDVLCHSHVQVVAACDTQTFRFLLSSLDAGLRSLDQGVSTMCAAAIDNLAGQYFNGLQASVDDKPNPAALVTEAPFCDACLAHLLICSPNGHTTR